MYVVGGPDSPHVPLSCVILPPLHISFLFENNDTRQFNNRQIKLYVCFLAKDPHFFQKKIIYSFYKSQK